MKLTDQQDAAIHTIDRHLSVDAGAGAGKTFVLIQRMLHLVENEHANLDEIVAITFTDLAAAEMRERLRETFRKKAESPESLASPERQTFWRSLQRRAETARISTIHAFCTSLLREQALRSGLDPNFAVLADAEAQLLLHDTVRDALHARMNRGDAATLEAAVEMGPGALRHAVEALVRQRYAVRRMAGAVPMEDPAALKAFWEKSLPGMVASNLAAAKRDYEFVRMSAELAAFEGLCDNEKDGREVLRLQILAALDAIARDEEPEAVRPLVARLGDRISGHKKANWPSPEAVDRLIALQDDARKRLPALFVDANETDPGPAAALSAAVYGCFAAAAEAYDAAKAERNALDFEDLIHRALALLDDPDRPVLRRTRAGIRHLLVDEFQDTDEKQYRIAALLTRLAEGEDGAKLFIVGDAKQSIYGWRGADVAVFKRAQERMGQAPLPLNTNFRSSPQVLAFVNDFFHRSGALCDVERDYVPMRWHRPDAADPGVEFLLTPVPEDAENKTSADALRELEARSVADRIAALCDPATGLDIADPDTGVMRKAQARDVAILLRSRGIAHAYERALQRLGIPYALEAGPSFHERQETTDLRNLLAAVADPWNEAALLAFLRSPACALDDAAIFALGTSAPLAQAFHGDAAPVGLADPTGLNEARALYRDLRARRHDALPDFIDYAIDRTAYEAIWLAQFMGVQKAANVRKVCEMAEGFAPGGQPGLGAFIRYLDESMLRELRENEAGVPSGTEGAVTLMTIHKSKGLEFPIVFLANTTAGPGGGHGAGYAFDERWGLAAVPRDEAGKAVKSAVTETIALQEAMRERAESMRILYVAMTRARDYLALPGFLPAGKTKPDKRSAFHAIASVYDLPAFAGKGEMVIAPERRIDGLAPCRVRIVRAAPAARSRTQPPPSPTPPADWSAWRTRLEPLAPPASARRFFAVTEVAKAMAGAAGTADPAAAPSGRANAMVRGTVVHAVFERWDFKSDPASLLDEALALHAPAPKAAEALRAEVLPRLRAMANHDLARRLHGDRRRTSEAPFALCIGDGVVEGSIDALLSDGTIIDYKTGGIHDDLGRAYAAQVRLYALAAQRIRGVTPGEGLLWYVDRNEVRTVGLSPAKLAEAERAAVEAIARLRAQPLPQAAEAEAS